MGFEPATLRTQGTEPTTEPPCPTVKRFSSMEFAYTGLERTLYFPYFLCKRIEDVEDLDACASEVNR